MRSRLALRRSDDGFARIACSLGGDVPGEWQDDMTAIYRRRD